MGQSLSLEAKKALLQEKGLGLMEKKALREILSNLALLALHMGCNVRSCIINFGITQGAKKDDSDTLITVIVSNSENDQYCDQTETIKDIKDQNPILEALGERITEVIKDLSETVWNTPVENIVFQAWSDKDSDRIHAHVKPKAGFPESEVILLT